MKKKRESKRQKKTKNGRVEMREKKALKIYSPDGRRLLFTAKDGFSVDYQELLRREKRKSKISYPKGSYKRFSDFA